MKKIFQGKIALVTGSAKNLGAAIAVELAKKGATVVVHHNTSTKNAMQTFRKVKKLSPNSILVQADLMNIDDVEKTFDMVEKNYGRLDILINTVGDFIWKKISRTDEKELDYIVRNNLITAFSAMQKALPLMRKNRYGRIINFGCVGCDRITIREMTSPYYVAKTGLYILTKTMSISEAKYSITINMISPGIIETSVVRPKKDKMPMRRYASFDDILNALIFFLSEESDYVTGSNIEVAGAWFPGMIEEG